MNQINLSSFENKIIQSILTDDLEKARFFLNQSTGSHKLLLDLLKKVENRPVPLNFLKIKYPSIIHIPTSFTCQIGCKMCNAGFNDRTSIYSNRNYLLPEEFDNFKPWIETATHINLVGIGETLESPYIPDLLKKITKKVSMITTSGVPLNKKKVGLFIELGLKYLNLSFDGNTTLGHGGGKLSYTKMFWKKVDMIQEVKRELGSKFPILLLNVSINSENIDNLDELLSVAHKKKISYVDLVAMFPINTETLNKSIFPDLDKSLKRINKVISIWRTNGLNVTVSEKEEMKKTLDSCHFIDNYLIFNTPTPAPHPCCGPLDFPLDYPSMSKEIFWNSFPFRYLRYLHYFGEQENWPMVCQTCNLVSLKHFAKSADTKFFNKENNAKAYDLYRSISKLKNEKLYKKAEKGFLKILNLESDFALKGKIYFQLGLLKLVDNQYEDSLSFMKLAVGYYFTHGMAFAYLYLLSMFLEEPESGTPVRPTRETYMEKISKANGLI